MPSYTTFAIVSVSPYVYFKGRCESTGVGYEQLFIVDFTGSFDAVSLIYNSNSSLPKRGNFLTTSFGPTADANVFVSNVEVEVIPDSAGTGITGYTAQASYKVSWSQCRVDEIYKSPLDRAPEIEATGSDVTTVSIKDKDNHAMVNSTGDLYDNLPDQYLEAVEVNVTRNESSNPITNIATYSYAVNSASWNGVAAGNGCIGKISAQKIKESILGTEVIYWRVTYPLKFRVDGFRFKPIDSGYRILDDDDNPVKYVDETGQEPSTPVLLDGSGAVDTSGDGVIFPTAGYKILQEQAWATLSLPNVFA